MKKNIIFLLLLCFVGLFFGCKGLEEHEQKYHETETFKQLSNVIFDTNKKYESINRETVHNINNLNFKIMEEIFTDNKNYVFSPISLYVAMSLLAEGSSENFYDLIKEFMSFSDLEELKEINRKLLINNNYEVKNNICKLSNSIWIKHDYDINENYVSQLQNNYLAEAFKVDFDNLNDQDNIVKWMNNKTKNFLKIEKFETIPDLAVLLVNALYFENAWTEEFDKSKTYQADFYGETTSSVYYMTHTLDSYFIEKEDYSCYYDYFKCGNSIVYVLPNEGISLNSLLKVNPMTDTTKKECVLNISVPKTEYSSDYTFNNYHSFNFLNNSNLEKIGEFLETPIIHQKAKIKFSEEGVKAAAITDIMVPGCAAPIETHVTVRLDRPFIYYILDSNGVILFSGVVNNPNN